MRATIAGVWDPMNRAEITAACRLARAGMICAIAVGNEGLEVRYEWEQLRQAMQEVRDRSGVPVTTTEQIDDYGDPRLLDPANVDFLLPNIHPVFYNHTDPKAAAEWTVTMAEALLDQSARGPRHSRALTLLIKEAGWPSTGLNHHTAANQALFWQHLEKTARQRTINFVWFEAFDQKWKHEVFMGVDIGVHWGLFTRDRQPKRVILQNGEPRVHTAEDQESTDRQ